MQKDTTMVGHGAGESQNSTDCGTSHNPATTMGFEQEASAAFPTDSKERENERRRRLKEEGQDVEKKNKDVLIEDDFDDCGEDLSSLVGTVHIEGGDPDDTSAAE